MAILYRNNARADSNNGGGPTTNLTTFDPAGFFQVDDVVILTLAYYTTATTPAVLTPPARWTLYRSDEQVHNTTNKIVTNVYYRVITTATTTPSPQTGESWTWSVPTEAHAVSASFSGCNTTTPFDVSAFAGQAGTSAGGGGASSASTAVSPSLTPSAANSYAMLLNVFTIATNNYSGVSTTFTPPSGETLMLEDRGINVSQAVVFAKQPATPTTTGTKTGTYGGPFQQARSATSLMLLEAPSPAVRYRASNPNFASSTSGSGAYSLAAPNPVPWVAGDYVLALFSSTNGGVSATPTGYTPLGTYSVSGNAWQVFGKVATTSAASPTADDLVSVTISPAGNYAAYQVVFTNPSSTNPVSGLTGTTDTSAAVGTPSTTALAALTVGNPNAAEVVFANGSNGSGGGATATGLTSWGTVNLLATLVAVETAKGTQPARTITWPASTQPPKTGLRLTLNNLNNPPNAPTLTSPTSNSSVNRAAIQRVAWTFSDPDLGDTQSAADVQWRQGTGAYTLVALTTTNGFYDFPAGTFTAAQVEVQVRTYDSFGLVGPWSPSLFFNAADMPGVPTITAPANNATIAAASMTVTWSTAAQTGYQVRTVADSAGVANTSVVYTDTGQVINSVTRSLTVSTAVNSRTEHVQVSVQANGLWSAFADNTYIVSFTPPATPLVTVTPSSVNGNVTVAVSNPTPTGGQPTVTSWDIYRRVTATGGVGIRIAASIGTTFVDYTPASGVDYEYQAVANATNGTTGASAWTGAGLGAPIPGSSSVYGTATYA